MLGLIFALSLNLAPQGEADMTRPFMAAIQKLRSAGGGTLTLAAGDYHFRSPVKRSWYVSNHDNDLPRNVFLPFENLTNVTVKSERAEFVFHGDGIALGLKDCRNLKLKGIAVDYSRPLNTEWHLVKLEDGMPVLETDPEKFPFSTEGGVLRNVGECCHGIERLVVAFGGDDHEHIYSEWFSGACERLSDRRVKLLKDVRRWRWVVNPEAADTVFVMRCGKRPNPAVFLTGMVAPVLEDVIVRASPGMGIICQLSTDVTIRGSKSAEARTAGAMPRPGSGRYTSLQADATHFSNCRGQVTVENCTFERMCDDAINVHSTCLKIDRRLPPRRLRLKFVHQQARGFELFAAGDTIHFIKARTLEAGAEARLKSARLLDPETYEVELEDSLPAGYAEGDTVESATWQPSVRFAGNVVNRNISRATLFTTPRPVVCESNRFERVSGSAVKLSGDSMNWYESGGCRSVTIRGNRFLNCLSSYCQGVIAIDPEIAEPTKQVARYHHNLRVEDNYFETHEVPLVWARSVSGFAWNRNQVVRNRRYRSTHRKPFHFEYSDNVTLDGVPAAKCPEATVEPEHTYMLLISGQEEVARVENEIIDLTDAQGFPFYLGNAAGNLQGALWDGRWEVCLLDECEAKPELLKLIAERAPHLKVVIQLRKTSAHDWPNYRTIFVGEAMGVEQAKIWARDLLGLDKVSRAQAKPTAQVPDGYNLAYGGAEVTKLAGITNVPPANAAYRNPALPIEERVEDLIVHMDMREKFAVGTMPEILAAGGIPRIGLGDFRTLDGPGGPRTCTSSAEGQPRVTYFPAPIAYAATWDKELVRQIGRALGEETRGCYKTNQVPARMLLGPTVNIARTPLGGRAFENYGEDPVLAGKTAAEFCLGLQSVKVSPCIKHFILNDQEWCRLVVDVNVSERALREIYARPFEIAAKEADVWAVMNSYNAVRGKFASCNLPMQQMLFDYGFTGAVYADWGGFKTPELSYNAGTTMWTCHSRNWAEIDRLVKKYEAGAFDKVRFNDNLRRNLRQAFRVGAFDQHTPADRAEQLRCEQSVGSKAHLDLAYRTAAESFVLLKNEDEFLPVDRRRVKKVAVIGPGADQQYSMIGKNGVHQCGGAAAIYPLAEPTVLEACVKEFGRENVLFAPGFRYDVHNEVTVPNMVERDPVAAARAADLVIFCGGTDHSYDREAAGGGYVQNADKKDLDLVGPQARLIERVAKVNPNVVVALNIGSPVIVEPWEEQVKGVIVTWYSGQAGARALVDTILGRVNPSGKLPYTFGYDLEDWPAHRLGELSYPGIMTNRQDSATCSPLAIFAKQEYLDGIWVGYRGFEHFGTEPKYPFGFGLSYTEFEYEEDEVDYSVKVTNIGSRPGRAVVQCYVAKPRQTDAEMPVKELVDYASVELKVGESKLVRFLPTREWTRYWCESLGCWRQVHGVSKVMIGSSSEDLPVEYDLEVK